MHCRLDDAAALDEQIRESEAAHPVGLLGDVVVLRSGARAARVNTPAIETQCAAALDAWSSRAAASAAARCAPGICPSAARTSRTASWFVLRDLPLPGSATGLSPPASRSRIRRPRELPAHRRAGQMPRAGGHSPRAQALGRGRAAVRAALGAQLGHRRFHRSRRSAAAGGGAGRGLRRHQPGARAVSVRSDAVFAVLAPRAAMR